MNNVININHQRVPRGIQAAAQFNSKEFILHAGDFLYRMGDQLPGLYMIHIGTLKLHRVTESGDQQIMGFFMPGEIIGLDAVEDQQAHSSAVALDTVRVTLLPFASITNGSNEVDIMQILNQLSATLSKENDLTLMLSQRTADRRVAWFLNEFSNSLRKNGKSDTEISLPMSRTDIATFLGLALETVCREISRLAETGVVEKNRHSLKITNQQKLKNIAAGIETKPKPFKQRGSII